MNLISSRDVTARLLLFSHHIDVWLQYLEQPVSLDNPNNWYLWDLLGGGHIMLSFARYMVGMASFFKISFFASPISYWILLWQLSPTKCLLHMYDVLVGHHLSHVHWIKWV